MKFAWKNLLVSLMFVPFFASAQKNISDENLNKANLLKQKYAESAAIILEAETNIAFDLSKEQVQVTKTSKDVIMSLRVRNNIKRQVSYDINSKITEGYVKSEKNRTIYTTPICGNYEDDDIFDSDNMLCVYPIEFNGLGEIQSFSYKLSNNDIRYFPSVYFQSDIPTQKVKLTITVPSWLDIELREINFKNYAIAKSVKKDPKKGTTIYEYTATDLDEFKDEPKSYGISHTYPHILLIARSFTNNDKKTNIISNIDDLHKWYNQLVVQLKNDNSSFKSTVDKITASAKTDLDKIKAIFYWVQDNIRYIAFENGVAGYKPSEAADVFRLKYGDCKGMANLTKWMLKTAGFDARLVWIGTKSVPYNYDVPSLAINNHMICCVNYNKKRFYLDATDKFIGFNDYSERIQGRVAMVEDGNSYFLDTIPIFNKERNLNTIDFKLSMQNNTLTGKCKQVYQGESHGGILYLLNNMPKEKQKEFREILITEEDKNIDANNIVNSDINDKENPYSVEADVIINNKVSNFDNDYYLDLDFYKDFNNQRIKEGRKSDLFLNEKKLSKMNVSLKIPAGFKVKYTPEPLEIKEKLFSFLIKYTVKKDEITYERIITIDNGHIPVTDIEKWNSSIKLLTDKYKESIILTKI
jgi:transglutaminase-like putative cysteine protease